MQILRAALVFFLMATSAWAEGLNAVARLDPSKSEIVGNWGGSVDLRLSLSQGVPFRVYTLNGPDRLVIDFNEVDFSSAKITDILKTEQIAALRFGPVATGWSRLVAEMTRPLMVEKSAMKLNTADGTALLEVHLVPVSRREFDAAISPAVDPSAPKDEVKVTKTQKKRPLGSRPTVVVLDPGHGGIDPGAENGGVTEASLMLALAREIKETLLRAGNFEVVMTRNSDTFVSLERRIAIAHEVGADLFLSIHADSLPEGSASGTTVYTLDQNASDEASAKLAERHNRDELLSGTDLTGADDVVAGVLMDIARLDNAPRSVDLAKFIVQGVENSTGDVYKKPLQKADFSVLKSSDIPSVLIEAGFLSTTADLRNLRDPAWRAAFAAGVRDGVMGWIAEDAAKSALRRQ